MIILGCGYLGTALARRALAAGEPVAALTRNATTAEELRALGAGPVMVADIAAPDWHDALNPADGIIVNCVSPSAAGPEGYRHSFIAGAQSIARWLGSSATAGRAPARELVFTSSTGVYPQTAGELVDEMTPVNSTTLSEAGKLLREAEEIFLALPRSQLGRAWILRLGGLYGPGRHQLLDELRAGKKTFSGGGDHWVNLLYRDDAVAAIHACLHAPPTISGGIFNAVDGEPVLKRDLVAWLATRLGQNADEIKFTRGDSARSAHRQSASGKIPHRQISNQKLRLILAWKPTCCSFGMGYDEIFALKDC